MKKAIWICLGAAFALASALLATNLRADDPFEVPITSGTGWPEFDPDGTLTFTLHDRVGGDMVTGRFVTFEVEMGHLNPSGRGFPGSPASGSMPVEQHPIFGDDGHITFAPHAAVGEEWSYGLAADSFEFSMRAVSVSESMLPLFNRRMQQALQNGPFPGYSELYDTGRTLYALNQAHCGFDMYDHIGIHDWVALSYPEPAYPVNAARVLGWPEGAMRTGGYTYVADCRASQTCRIDTEFRGWLHLRYRFLPEHLCSMPAIIEAHQDWLNDRVIDEETQILNPDFQ